MLPSNTTTGEHMNLFRFLLFGGMFFTVVVVEAAEHPYRQYLETISVITPNDSPQRISVSAGITVGRLKEQGFAGQGLRLGPWAEFNATVEREHPRFQSMRFHEYEMFSLIRRDSYSGQKLYFNVRFNAEWSLAFEKRDLGIGPRLQHNIDQYTNIRVGAYFDKKRTAEPQGVAAIWFEKRF